MTRPAVSETAERAFDALVPWNAADERTDWTLLRWMSAMTSKRAEIDDLVRDREYPGWSSLLDVDRVPAKGLPYLAQFLGVDVTPALSESDQRQQLRDVPGFKRGTPAAMTGAARPFLTGTKTVTLVERDTSAYHLTVRTFTAETPDPDLVEAALLSQKPAGLVLDYEVVDGLTWGEIKASGKTYGELTAEFPTSGLLKRAQTV